MVPYGAECDVWSAGIVLYALIYGQLPFRGVTVREIKSKVLAGHVNYKESNGINAVSMEVRDLLRKMLKPHNEESRRISIEEILDDEWL